MSENDFTSSFEGQNDPNSVIYRESSVNTKQEKNEKDD